MVQRKRGASRLAVALWAAVPAAVAVTAWRYRDTLGDAVGLIGEARWPWLGLAALAIAGVYAARAAAYRIPLTLLGYTIAPRLLWMTALGATALHQLIPTGGASGYAFLTYALHRRGVSGGQAPLIALIDTLSYSIAVGTLVLGSLLFLGVSDTEYPWRLVTSLLPATAVAALGVVAWRLQRDRARFVSLALRLKDRLARLLGQRWPDGPVRRFFDQYYEGKAVVAAHPRAFLEMVGLQYLTVAFDATALYLSFVALGSAPPPHVVFMGLVVAMAGMAVVAVPAGGGSFEVIMSAFFATHGLTWGEAIAATILYRVVAFWLPVLATLPALLELRRRVRDVHRRRAARPPRAARLRRRPP